MTELIVIAVMLIGFLLLMAGLDYHDDAELRKRDIELYSRFLDKRNGRQDR